MIPTQTHQHRACRRPFHQRGAVLIVSLLILFLLTIIGLAAMSRSTMDEKMTANMRDKQVAFEAAEYALRQAETSVRNMGSTVSFNGSNGLYGLNDTEPDYTVSGTWNSSTTNNPSPSTQVATAIAGVRTQPRYFAKVISMSTATGGAANISSYGGTGSSIYYIRITARGTGISNNSQVILREIYAKEF